MATLLRKNDIIEVAIYKEPSLGYGFSIMGGDPLPDNPKVMTSILISKVKPGAPAEKTKLVKPGQEVLGINGVDVVGCSHEEAVQHLRKADGLVMLKLKKLNRRTNTEVVLAQLGYEVVKCLFPFTAIKDDELSLTRDEIVFVKGKGADGWCFGQSQSTGKQGMFPGQFVMKLKVGPEILSRIAAELENLVPGISLGGSNSEVLYEELHGKSSTDGDKQAFSMIAENLYEKLNEKDGSISSPPDSPSVALEDVYPLAGPPGLPPRVVLVGKEVMPSTGVDPLSESRTSREHLYAPINQGRAGEVIYEPTPFEQQLQPEAETATSSVAPPIEDLYASVNKVLGKDSQSDSVSRRVDINDDMYATLESLQGNVPAVPERKYEFKNLLPPTLRIHLASTHDADEDASSSAYELLPGQKEFNLDEQGDTDASPSAIRTYDKMLAANVTPTPTPSPHHTQQQQQSPPPLPPVRKASMESIDPGSNAAIRSDSGLSKKALKKIQKDELKRLKIEAKTLKRDKKMADKAQKRLLKEKKGKGAREDPEPRSAAVEDTT